MYISVQNHLNHPKPTKTNQLSYGKITRLERPENLRAFPGPDLISCIYLLFKEFVLQSFLPWACSTSIKQVLVALETHCFIKLYVCFIFVCTHIQNMYQHTGNLFYNPPLEKFLDLCPFIISPYPENVSHLSNLIIVISLGQQLKTVGVQLPTTGVKLGSVLFCQLRSKGVDGDNEGPSVCLKLRKKKLSVVSFNFFQLHFNK